MRKDAARNRDALLDAAVAAFTKDANASLEGIARAAGVGIGTLYRHYPTREALVEAAYRNEVERLCAAAAELLQKHAPVDALARWMARFIDYMATKRGMADALRAVTAAGGNPFNQSRALLTQSIALLVDAGKADGTLRPDLTVDDVLSMSPLLQNEDVAQAKRVAAILLDGMRASRTAHKRARD